MTVVKYRTAGGEARRIVTDKFGHKKQHWAAKCGTTFAQDFDQKGIPLEVKDEEVQQKELKELKQYFLGDAEKESVKAAAQFAALALTDVFVNLRLDKQQ